MSDRCRGGADGATGRSAGGGGRQRGGAAALVVALLVLGAVFVAAGARSPGGSSPGDTTALSAVARVRSPWLTVVAEAVSRTGDVLVVVPVVVAGIWLWRRRERSAALVLAVSTVLAPLLAGAAKALVERSRPEVVEPLVATTRASFPSGHALTAVGAYGMLAVLLWQRGHRALAVACGAWALLVGVTRVYLGVHYATDLLGSVAAGVALVLVLAVAQRWWRDRRETSRPPLR